MFRAVSDFFRKEAPKREERFLSSEPAFFDNSLGPIKWIWPQDDAEGTQQHAFELAAFHACVRVIAESVASLPFHLIKEDGEARERAKAHHLYDLVHDRPNPVQTSYELIETHVQHVAVWGNAYLLKVFDKFGRVEELWPLHPSQVMPQQLSNNDIVYDYMPASPDEARRFSSGRIIHTRYISDNGYMGMVPVRLAAGVIEQARAMDAAAARFWANDARPGVILETSMPVPEQALIKLRQQWEQLHRGVENTGRTAVLPNGVTVKQLPPITNEASQWTAVRTFCVEEVARQMRVPGSLVGLRTTYANSEQEALSWLQSIVPWCRRVESSFGRSLLEGMDGYSFQLDTRGMLRGDASTRSAFYSSGLNNGWLTVNEVRRLEDMPRIDLEAADEPFLAANNMRPMSQAYDLIKNGSRPDEPPAEPPAEEEQVGSLESSRSMPPRDEKGRFVKAEAQND